MFLPVLFACLFLCTVLLILIFRKGRRGGDLSRSAENVIGVQRSKRKKQKATGNGKIAVGSNPETELSRPLSQIIQETFTEEIQKLSESNSVQGSIVSKRKPKGSKKKIKDELTIITPGCVKTITNKIENIIEETSPKNNKKESQENKKSPLQINQKDYQEPKPKPVPVEEESRGVEESKLRNSKKQVIGRTLELISDKVNEPGNLKKKNIQGSKQKELELENKTEPIKKTRKIEAKLTESQNSQSNLKTLKPADTATGKNLNAVVEESLVKCNKIEIENVCGKNNKSQYKTANKKEDISSNKSVTSDIGSVGKKCVIDSQNIQIEKSRNEENLSNKLLKAVIKENTSEGTEKSVNLEKQKFITKESEKAQKVSKKPDSSVTSDISLTKSSANENLESHKTHTAENKNIEKLNRKSYKTVTSKISPDVSKSFVDKKLERQEICTEKSESIDNFAQTTACQAAIEIPSNIIEVCTSTVHENSKIEKYIEVKEETRKSLQEAEIIFFKENNLQEESNNKVTVKLSEQEVSTEKTLLIKDPVPKIVGSSNCLGGLTNKEANSENSNSTSEILSESHVNITQVSQNSDLEVSKMDTSGRQLEKVTINIITSETPKELERSKHSEVIDKISTMTIEDSYSQTQVRVLVLNDKEYQDSTLYRLKKGYTIEFQKGPSLFGRKVYLYCNYPKNGEEFKRNKYVLVDWSHNDGSDDTAMTATIKLTIAGSFHYYFTYNNALDGEPQGSGFFIIDPVLKYGNDEELPLDCVQCQTVLAKSLGPFDSWEYKLRVGKESGYNMIHFTPIQELGESNSSYCLKDQMKLNPIFNTKRALSFDDVHRFITKIRKEWKMASICDIVLNHTANETPWLIQHPEATYNCQNCPYMRPAYLFDAALHRFSQDIKDGVYENQGIPPEINKEDHLNAIRYALHTNVLNKLKLQELFICDVNKLLSEFLTLARSKVPRLENTSKKLNIIQDPEYRRLASKVDMDLALQIYNVYRNDCFDEETRMRKCSEEFKSKLDALNQEIIDKLNDDLNSAVENCVASIRYFRVQADGPKFLEISVQNPLLYRYFTDYGEPLTLEDHEKIMYSADGRYLMAHNGWVMNSDPLHNFASDSKVYLRRELIAWGDSVKLRYGEKPEDCPFLWSHMQKYVETTAKIFDGVRLDNCHSTPIHVAEYLLDIARKIRPDLYVVAELFTNSDEKDNIFVNRLGITSLIREAMSAWDSHELGRLVYRYGGDPVGAFYQPRVRPLVPSIAHALFLDLTHDNQSPIEKRSVFDLLPSAALVNMACCASGSNRGYDELVPHHIHVVDEIREYTEWSEKVSEDVQFVSKNTGIIAAKRALNELHHYLGRNGFNQVYVDQVDSDIVTVTRHNTLTHESVILVAFTAFRHPEIEEVNNQRYIKPLRIEGELNEIILEATLKSKAGSKYHKVKSFSEDNRYITGYKDYEIKLKEHIQLEHSDILIKGNSGDMNVVQLDFKDFKPGTVVAVKVSLAKNVEDSIKKLRLLVSHQDNNSLKDLIDALSYADLNRALYRCDQEERDDGLGFGSYDIPNFGPLVYCGLQGAMSLLMNIRAKNDLGHPLCTNLRSGNWMMDYIVARLKAHEGTKHLGGWFESSFLELRKIPTYLIPSYFDFVLTHVYASLLERCYKLMSEFVKSGSSFVKSLSLGSIQFGAVIKSAPLPALSPNLEAPKPPTVLDTNGKKIQACITLSAGLPHFSTGYMRNWGRDTFIALRGLFLLTGRYEDARYHILGYAASLRHGLIPNLLDGGKARYNARDAVWWWLYSIQCYVQEAPHGEKILSDIVSRLYPTDDATAQNPGTVEQPLYELIQEMLTVHFQGLTFRERNAGRQIDEHMSDRGFNIQIGVHPETGFVFGGNESNCGTWMDKMGSSDKAGNRGKPATPRDGSAVELIGLSKSVITWLSNLNRCRKYPYSYVERVLKNGACVRWTFTQWAEKIQKNFEKCFWINSTPVKGEYKPDLINQRGIYKDTFNASQPWCDFQFRCNFPIAMVVAPELFDPQHAWISLEMCEKHLLGPLGMKTLDSSDWNYCGDYDVSNDSSDFKLAHGFNYHQGPEWVWPIGFYLRARLIFGSKVGQQKQSISTTKEILSAHFAELQKTPWRGLPELTNTNGSYCEGSSKTQAWSMSCILEVLHELQNMEIKGSTQTN